MPLLRFESYLRSPVQRDVLSSLADSRERLLTQHAMCFEEGKNRDARLPADTSFFSLPQQLLYAYEQHRVESELGRVFRIANGMHDSVDALVILGEASSTAGIRALFQTCCDPYHNELSRAERGAKPRIYFAGDAFDNDGLQSLISRIKMGGYGNLTPENRWALLTIDEHADFDQQNADACEVILAFEQLMKLDPISNTIIRSCPSTNRFASDEAEMLAQSRVTCGAKNILSPAGLLPAAFLGLDCVQLLVGAHEMNEHFRNANPEENLILQYAAMMLGPGVTCQPPEQTSARELSSSLCIWSQTYDSLARWWQTLFGIQRHPVFFGNERSGAVHTGGPGTDSILHLAVNRTRTDGVVFSDGKLHLQNELSDQIQASIVAQQAIGMDVAKITLPVIDANSLGQLIEFFLLTSAILE